MSNKRPLSPESNNGHINNDSRSMKRFKLHSIIQELRNEEANLVVLKKLRLSQQIASRTNPPSLNNTQTTNGFHTTATRMLTNNNGTNKPMTPVSTDNILSKPASQPAMQPATRKPTIPVNPTPMNKTVPVVPSKTPTPSNNQSLEERKTQAKKALRQQLERDLLNIPPPKPLLQDILFIPNPNSLEFQPYIGLEDVVQCLCELQADRHRLPQRFTDRAQTDEPNVCDHCGTDFTIRWWKHLNTANSTTNILCDRCKKQVTRRTLKSDHSALLKNVFVSAMEQEKEIEKSFQALMKQQQKNSSRSSSSSSTPTSKPVSTNRPVVSSPVPSSVPSMATLSAYLPSTNHPQSIPKPKPKTSLPSQTQNFATKLSQQATLPSNAARKSNPIPQTHSNSTTHSRIPTQQHSKIPMPAHQHSSLSAQQQFRSPAHLSQHMINQPKNLSMNKVSKNVANVPNVRHQSAIPSRSNFLAANAIIPTGALHPTVPAGNNIRPTATKRRTLQ